MNAGCSDRWSPVAGTILPHRQAGHKVRPPGLPRLVPVAALRGGAIRGAFLVVGLLALPLAAQGQGERHSLRPADGVWIALGVGLYAVPHVFGINEDPASCGPCNSDEVPWFDRWAISEPRPFWSHASGVTIGALAVLAGADLVLRSNQSAGTREVVRLVQAGALALGVVELSKALVARNRPVLYTLEAPQAREKLDSRRSWPSGHTGMGVAVATSYFLSAGRRGPSEAWRRWAALGAGVAVGAMRVAAGRHFPSDVLGGAVLGALSGLAVHRIEF